MDLKIKNLFRRYFDKQNNIPRDYHLRNTSNINAKFNNLSTASTFFCDDIANCTTTLAKVSGIDMSYLKDAQISTIVFNKILSGQATESWVNDLFDDTKVNCLGLDLSPNKHKFFGVYVPMYMKDKFSTNAIKAMQRYLIARLGLTDADRIDANLEEYFRPNNVTDLWNIYYNKEKNITVVISSGDFERHYGNIEFARVFYNEYLFNGTEIPDEIVDYIDEALVVPYDYNNITQAYYGLDASGLFAFTDEQVADLTKPEILLAQTALLNYAYKINPDLLSQLREEEIKNGLEQYVNNKIHTLENNVERYRCRYKDYQEQARSEYEHYLEVNEELAKYKTKTGTFIEDTLKDINHICSANNDIQTTLFEGIVSNRNNASKYDMEFITYGPAQGIDLDDLELLERNWTDEKPEHWEEIITLLKGETPYRFYLGQKVRLCLDNMKPSYTRDAYSISNEIQAMPNPHLYYYNCWGNVETTLRELNNHNDLATCLAVFLKASLSINVRDGAVMTRLREGLKEGNEFYDSYNNVINIDTGECISFAQYLNILHPDTVEESNDDDDDL